MNGSFYVIMLQTLWQWHFWLFSEHSETSSNIPKQVQQVEIFQNIKKKFINDA